ncbi:MAG TPA: hypothetical protein VJC13_02520 [Candidatus Paceibacterota bacterium]
MFKKINWVGWVVIVVVIALVVWWGMSNSSSTSQSAGVLNSINPTNANYVQVSYDKDQINRIVAIIDAKLKIGVSGLDNIGANPTQAKIVSTANSFKNVAVLMETVNAQLGSAIINANATGLSSTLRDANAQLSNAASQISVVLSNTSGISANETTASWMPLKQALIQLKLAQSYLQLVRMDIAVLVKGLK